MRKLLIVASLILTIVMFLISYVVIFVTSAIAVGFKLPGPYADAPIAWLWFGLHITMMFGVSFLLCRWFAHRISKQVQDDRSEKI